MNSRGRYSSRFIKSGNYQRPSYSDKDRSFRRQQTSEIHRRSFVGGRGASREHFHRWDSNTEHVSFEQSKGRERGFSKRNTHSFIGSPRSRYLGGHQINKKQQEREIHSLRQYKQRGRGRFSEDKRILFNDKVDEEFLIVSDADDLELQFPIDPVDSSDENEIFNDCKIPLEREMSPLIIHRSFGRESLKSDSQERTLEKRSRSPLDSRCRSIEKYDRKNSFGRPSRRSSFSIKRSLSRSPRAPSQDKFGRNRKGSIVRSVASFRRSKSNARSKKSEHFREEYLESNSLAFIKQQIEYEKKRKRFLERQTRRHDKRSESSVERLLNDCKTSTEIHSESSPTHILSFQSQNTKQSDNNKMLYTEKPPSPNVNVLGTKTETTVQLRKSEDKNNSSSLDINTFSKKKNVTNNSFEIGPELSPISQTGSFNVVDCLPDKKDLHEEILNLSPISQVGSYEKREFSDHIEIRLDLSPISQTESFANVDRNDKPAENELLLSPISQASRFDQTDKKLELSPISQAGSFEQREFSQDQAFSPISLSGSFGKNDLEPVETQKADIERPNSADSLKKFLEEFRYTDESRSSDSVSSKNGKDNYAFPKNEINNSIHGFDEVNNRYGKESQYSGNDHVSKVKNNKVEDNQTSFRKSSSYEIAEKRTGSLIQSSKTKRKKYETYNTNVQRESTSDRSKYSFNQGSESLPNYKRYQNIFQDQTELYDSHNKAITSYEMSKINLNQASFHNDLRRRAQNVSSHQTSSALYNELTGRHHQHSDNSINQSNFNKNLNRQILDIPTKTHNIHEVPIKSGSSAVTDSSNSNSLLLNRVPQYRPMNEGYNNFKQESQIHKIPLNSQNYSISGPNYGMAESINQNQQYQPITQMGTQIMPSQIQTQTVPYNTFGLRQNKNLPNSMPGTLNTNLQHENYPYQAGQRCLTLERPDQNLQANQTVSSWNLTSGNINNQLTTFDKGYGRLNTIVPENALYKTNSTTGLDTVNQPHNILGYQNPSSFKDINIKNKIPLNEGQSYLPQGTQLSQSQVQNFRFGYKTLIPNESLIQCLDRPPPVPHFQQIQSNADISIGIMANELKKLIPAPDLQQASGNANQNFTFQPDYNTPTLPFTSPDRQSQCIPFQSNVPPYGAQPAQGQYGSNNSQILQENLRTSQSTSANTFLSGPRNLLGPQCSSAMNSGTNPNLDLKQPTYVDLKKYLSGTFKPGYKSALGLNVSDDCEGRSRLMGDYQPPVSACFPNPVFTMRFRDTPASPEELGGVFDKFVIFFDVRQNGELEKEPFVVIQDSFSKSDRFGRLDVEEQSQLSFSMFQPPFKHSCVLRWKGVMLARADGNSKLEARQKASISLINALAHTCYTVQAKNSYYFGGKLAPFMMNIQESPGVYKIIGRKDFIKSVTDILELMKSRGIKSTTFYSGNKGVDPTNINVVINLIEDFFLTEKDSICELILGGSGPSEFSLRDLSIISEHVNKYDFLQWRRIKGFGRSTYIGISRRFTPQELCSFLIAVQDNNVRYKLLPPQERRVELLMPDGQYSASINKNIMDVQTPMTPAHIQPGDRGIFQSSVSIRGGGRGEGHQGKWMGFS